MVIEPLDAVDTFRSATSISQNVVWCKETEKYVLKKSCKQCGIRCARRGKSRRRGSAT